MSDGKILNENGENIMPITHETCVITDSGNTVADKIGDIALMNTEGGSLVEAINILYDATIKEQIVGALVEKGVEITTNDSWSTIINAIKAEEGGGGLDIITSSNLPSSGKDGQICVVTNASAQGYVISTNPDVTYDVNKIYLYSGNNTPNYSYTNDEQTYHYEFYKASCNNQMLDSYFWSNNQWNTLTRAVTVLLEDGKSPSEVYAGGLNTSSTITYMTDGSYNDRGYLRVPSSSSYYHATTTVEQIDFSNFSTVEVDARMVSGNAGAKTMVVGKSTSGILALALSNSWSSYCTAYTGTQSIPTTPTTLKFDISSISGTGYLTIFCSKASYQVAIYSVRMY